MVRAELPPVGDARHGVDPGPVVALGPVLRFWTATGGDVSALRPDRLPVSSTSLWTRPTSPADDEVPLRLHFDVKAALGFEHAVITRHRTVVVRPSRIGDRIGHHQVLRSVGAPRATPLGPGRSWEVDHVLVDGDGDVLQTETFTAVGYVPRPALRRRLPPAGPGPGAEVWTTHRISAAAAAARVWAPVHHDPVAARRAGLPGVIACTQHLVSIVEQERTGAGGGDPLRVLDLHMRRPVVATREG